MHESGSRAAPPSQAQLIEDHELTDHSVVANSTMNRERGLTGVNSYPRELGFDPAEFLEGRGSVPSWLDLCSGEGIALRTAALGTVRHSV
ncbi:hypothetical protein [Streptomyces sp. NPDC058398]|uniref:hypothetical protein n=1 Tax=Streptomyces sp. NPDC058398 TaxID=3346479 RepID=UPI0036471609